MSGAKGETLQGREVGQDVPVPPFIVYAPRDRELNQRRTAKELEKVFREVGVVVLASVSAGENGDGAPCSNHPDNEARAVIPPALDVNGVHCTQDGDPALVCREATMDRKLENLLAGPVFTKLGRCDELPHRDMGGCRYAHAAEQASDHGVDVGYLQDAKFAFLAACHTAEQSEIGLRDEVLHLAGAMQSSGFRSVVGTMWVMTDEDGPNIARMFYKEMLKGKMSARERHARAAKALWKVTRQMIREGKEMDRWVNYVHIGA